MDCEDLVFGNMNKISYHLCYLGNVGEIIIIYKENHTILKSAVINGW